jgi:putative glutamine amidotransferase
MLQPAIALTATTELIRDLLRTRLNVAYTAAAREAGLRPFILPVLDAADADAMLEGMDGLLLTGGEDIGPEHYGERPHSSVSGVHAGRDAFELALVRAARARGLPTLAICRGMQVANVALGGTLVQDIPSQLPDALAHASGARGDRTHAVRITSGSRLARACGASEIRVNSSHHQSLGQIARGLLGTALAPDGVIEGVEWDDDAWWMLGAQWHPEELIRTPEPWDRALFAAFAEAARRHAVSSADASALHS